MSSEFDTNLPSVRQVQSMIKDSRSVELKLLTGEMMTGKISWQDPTCICFVDEANQQTLVWRQAIAYVKPKG